MSDPLDALFDRVRALEDAFSRMNTFGSLVGATGPAGGATGATGPRGYTGPQGPTGATGPLGPVGTYNSTSLTSLSIGTGTKTLTLSADCDLAIGTRVRIAYEFGTTSYMEGLVTAFSHSTLVLQVSVTYTAGSGTWARWLVSIAGEPGATGPSGPQGPTGAQGPTGPAGATGAGVTGATGPQGPTGPQGITGPAGSNGTNGATGPQGATGAQGPTGYTGPAATLANPTASVGIATVNGVAATAMRSDAAPAIDKTIINNVSVITASGTLDLSTSYADVPGVTVTFTPGIDEYALVMVTTNFVLSAGTAAAQVGDDVRSRLDLHYSSADNYQTPLVGVIAPGITAGANIAAGTLNAVKYFWLSLTAGTTYTIKLQGTNVTGDRGRIGNSTQMMIWRLPR